jgi:hypothetical protein
MTAKEIAAAITRIQPVVAQPGGAMLVFVNDTYLVTREFKEVFTRTFGVPGVHVPVLLGGQIDSIESGTRLEIIKRLVDTWQPRTIETAAAI